MTVEAVDWKRESRGYFIAPKRLSNEFDDTIGAEPATWLSLVAGAGAGAPAAVSGTDGFSAGLAAALLGSALGAVAPRLCGPGPVGPVTSGLSGGPLRGA